MSTELQKYSRDQYAEASVPATVDEALRLGEIMGQSGMFEGIQVPQAVAKVIAGRELGIGPMAAMRGVNIIKGKVNLSAELVAMLIKRSGRYDFRAEVGDESATVTIYDRGEALSPVTFTIDDAKRAGLFNTNANYAKYPGDMCFTKAIVRAARRHCPEVIGGAVYMDDGDDPVPAAAEARATPGSTAALAPGTVAPTPEPTAPAAATDASEPAEADLEPARLAASRYEEVRRLGQEAGVEDMGAIYQAHGVLAQGDLLADDKYAAVKRAITGEADPDEGGGQLFDTPEGRQRAEGDA